MNRLARRQRFEPRDTRELVFVPGIGTMTCDAYKAGGAVPTMKVIDSMSPEWRALIHEFGMDAWDFRRYPLAQARKMLQARFARR